MNNKNKLIELILYVFIVIVGVVLLIASKVNETKALNNIALPEQVSIRNAERRLYDATISNR